MTNLTGAPVLDVAIGLSFVYLALSLLASAVQEWIAAVLALRSRTLEDGLRSMLAEDDTLLTGTSVPPAATEAIPRNLLEDFYAHPLIRSLYKTGHVPFKPKKSVDAQGQATLGPWQNGRLPSYISPHTFAVALSDILGVHPRLVDLETTIGGLGIPAGVKYRLLTLVRQTDNDVQQFQAQLEKWFDDTMARVSGWYKRRTQWILVVLAVLLTLGLNANSVTLGQALFRDPTVRAAVVAEASSSNVAGQTSGSTPAERLKNAANNVSALQSLGLPLGWPQKSSDPAYVRLDTFGHWVKNLIGWIITIGAISLGAPFWFDALGRLSRLRGSGKPETPLPATGSGKPNERVATPAVSNTTQ